jgi:hypothetical protein
MLVDKHFIILSFFCVFATISMHVCPFRSASVSLSISGFITIFTHTGEGVVRSQLKYGDESGTHTNAHTHTDTHTHTQHISIQILHANEWHAFFLTPVLNVYAQVHAHKYNRGWPDRCVGACKYVNVFAWSSTYVVLCGSQVWVFGCCHAVICWVMWISDMKVLCNPMHLRWSKVLFKNITGGGAGIKRTFAERRSQRT